MSRDFIADLSPAARRLVEEDRRRRASAVAPASPLDSMTPEMRAIYDRVGAARANVDGMRVPTPVAPTPAPTYDSVSDYQNSVRNVLGRVGDTSGYTRGVYRGKYAQPESSEGAYRGLRNPYRTRYPSDLVAPTVRRDNATSTNAMDAMRETAAIGEALVGEDDDKYEGIKESARYWKQKYGSIDIDDPRWSALKDRIRYQTSISDDRPSPQSLAEFAASLGIGSQLNPEAITVESENLARMRQGLSDIASGKTPVYRPAAGGFQIDPRTGKPLVGPDGWPVTVDPRAAQPRGVGPRADLQRAADTAGYRKVSVGGEDFVRPAFSGYGRAAPVNPTSAWGSRFVAGPYRSAAGHYGVMPGMFAGAGSPSEMAAADAALAPKPVMRNVDMTQFVASRANQPRMAPGGQMEITPTGGIRTVWEPGQTPPEIKNKELFDAQRARLAGRRATSGWGTAPPGERDARVRGVRDRAALAQGIAPVPLVAEYQMANNPQARAAMETGIARANAVAGAAGAMSPDAMAGMIGQLAPLMQDMTPEQRTDFIGQAIDRIRAASPATTATPARTGAGNPWTGQFPATGGAPPAAPGVPSAATRTMTPSELHDLYQRDPASAIARMTDQRNARFVPTQSEIDRYVESVGDPGFLTKAEEFISKMFGAGYGANAYQAMREDAKRRAREAFESMRRGGMPIPPIVAQ